MDLLLTRFQAISSRKDDSSVNTWVKFPLQPADPANQIWSIWLWFQTWYFPRIVARLHCLRWPGATRGTLQERRPPRRTRESPRLLTSRLPMQGWRKSKGWLGTWFSDKLGGFMLWLMIAWSWYCRDAEIIRQKQQKKAEAAAAGGSGGSSKKWGSIASCNNEERDRKRNNRRLGILWHPLWKWIVLYCYKQALISIFQPCRTNCFFIFYMFFRRDWFR